MAATIEGMTTSEAARALGVAAAAEILDLIRQKRAAAATDGA